MTGKMEKIKEGYCFKTLIDNNEYECYIYSSSPGYEFTRYFSMWVKKLKSKSFLGIKYIGTVWEFDYYIGEYSCTTDGHRNGVKYELIDDVRWYDTKWVKELVPQAIKRRQQKIDKEVKDKIYAQSVKHAKTI